MGWDRLWGTGVKLEDILQEVEIIQGCIRYKHWFGFATSKLIASSFTCPAPQVHTFAAFLNIAV